MLSHIKIRAKAALIHELLHFKYLSDERKVRKLTKKYLRMLGQIQSVHNDMSEASHMKFHKPARSLGRISEINSIRA